MRIRRGKAKPSPGFAGDVSAFLRLETLSVRSSPAFTWVERVGAATTILLFVVAILQLGGQGPVWSLVLVVWICLLATGALILVVLQDRRLRRRTRYASALERLHSVHHLLRDASAALLRNCPLADVIPVLSQTMTAAAEVFTVATGARCRACIKSVHWSTGDGDPVPVADPVTLRDLLVSTVCRDEATGKRPGDGGQAHVDQNTDFELLFLRRDRYRWFMSNDLEREVGYKNSSWSLDLPKDYLSTCVWPIQKQDPTADNNHDTLGFLCIDSLQTNLFDNYFDFLLGAGIADALYVILKLLHLRRHGMTSANPVTN